MFPCQPRRAIAARQQTEYNTSTKPRGQVLCALVPVLIRSCRLSLLPRPPPANSSFLLSLWKLVSGTVIVMPRDSSERSKASQPLKFQQSLIDVPGSAIEARVIQERDLEPDHLGWLLGPDPNSPRSVGISPAYSQSGGLPALACALDSRVLIITFLSSTAYSDGNVNGGGTRPRNTKRREMLEEKMLCHPLVTLYAFDLAPLALCLHLHTHLRLTEAIDIQSALHISDRSIIDSVKVVLSDTIPIFSDNIHNTFENMLYKSNKEIELMGLVQRAWLSGWIGQYDYEGIRDMFYKSPKVDMTKFSAGELNILQKMAYDMLRKDNMKPGSVTHETKTRWDPKRQRMVASSQRYANRIQDSQRVKFTLTHSSANKFVLAGGISNVRGKSGHIEVDPYLEGKEIVSITTHGKDGPTQAEQDRSLSLLSVLQGTSHLLENHWMKALWQPSQPVDWPDCFFSPDPPTIEINQHPDSSLNDSQISAITDMLSFAPISLVQGPPGTGKTTVIATYVLSAIQAEQKGIWLMAQSNVAVKNIAEKLAKVGFFNFKLLVSRNFHFEWHEHLYKKIEKNIIVSDKLPKRGALRKVLQGSQVILCTLSMISNPRLQDLGLTQEVPIIKVIIDEASQIEVGQYVPLFKTFGKTLRKICFIGDDKQLPPHGQDDLGNLQSIFELSHLRGSLSFLNTQYRMPPQIGDFISEHVYDGKLESNPSHVIPSSVVACRFVDVHGSEQLDSDGKSSFNQKEVEAIVLLARHLQEENISYRIITPYDAQRNMLERALENEDLKWQDKCFNVDSFQGNEDDVIIISVVRSKALGFLTNTHRTNVMLTRCKRRMYIVSSRAFLEGKGSDSLVGMMAAELGSRPGAWLTQKDLEDGRIE